METFIRVRDLSRTVVPHTLDLGVRGIITLDVQSVEKARRLVEYVEYHPLGARGLAFSRGAKCGFLPELKQIGNYFIVTNQRAILMPQCETAGTLEHVKEIAVLNGIDDTFVGPYDLSVALGIPVRFATPWLTEALSRVIAACRAFGKLAFIHANIMPEARAYLAQGYQGAVIGVDTAFLTKVIQGMSQAQRYPVLLKAPSGRDGADPTHRGSRPWPDLETACLCAGARLRTTLHHQPYPALFVRSRWIAGR